MWTPEGHLATFSAGHGGLASTDVGAATFEDQCSRHLAGDWRMFTPESNGLGGCPFGYSFGGGG